MLDRIEAVAELVRTVLFKSRMAKAVTYARNQPNTLRRYSGDGRLTIDNNVSERTLTQNHTFTPGRDVSFSGLWRADDAFAKVPFLLPLKAHYSSFIESSS